MLRTSARSAPAPTSRDSSSARAYSRRASSRIACALSVRVTKREATLLVDGSWSHAAPGGHRNADCGADLGLDLCRDVTVLSQPLAGVVLALADLVAVVRVPGAGLLDDVMHHAKLDDFAFTRNTFTVENIEQRFAKRRRDLVLDHFDPRFVGDDFLAALDRANAADDEPDRGVELECVAAGGRLRVAAHHSDFHADLIDENNQNIGALDIRRELAQRLTHQPSLQAGQLVAHFAFDFRLGHERGNRIDDNDVDSARAHQHIGNFQALLPRIRLGNEHLADVHPQLAGIDRIERILGVDIGGDSAELLLLRYNLQAERRLARGFGSIDLDHAPTRQAADTKRDVQAERSGRHHLQIVLHLGLAHLHDRALAELLFNL